MDRSSNFLSALQLLVGDIICIFRTMAKFGETAVKPSFSSMTQILGGYFHIATHLHVVIPGTSSAQWVVSVFPESIPA